MQEEQRVATGGGRARVHELGARGAVRPQQARASGHGGGRALDVAGRGDDHLGAGDAGQPGQVRERPRERGGVVASGDDDRQPGRHQNRPCERSRPGSTSRHVVHQPVRTVSANSGGSPSASISFASISWS